MAQLVVMYKTPTDAAAFDKHYFEKHVPLAKNICGLRKYQVSRGGVGTPFGPSAYHLVAILEFDDLAAIQGVFASAEGQAARLTFRRSPPAASSSSCSIPAKSDRRLGGSPVGNNAAFPRRFRARVLIKPIQTKARFRTRPSSDESSGGDRLHHDRI